MRDVIICILLWNCIELMNLLEVSWMRSAQEIETFILRNRAFMVLAFIRGSHICHVEVLRKLFFVEMK